MRRLDPLTKAQRSERMSRIRSKNTALELRIRKALHSRGYRFRLHGAALPGKPDIVFGPRRKVIFVHGCFWHLHRGCREYRLPRSRVRFWTEKLARNKARDRAVKSKLSRAGWSYFVVWECELKNFGALLKRIEEFLKS